VELHFVSEAVLHIRCRDTLRGLLRQARHWAEYNALLYKMYHPVRSDFSLWKACLWECRGLLSSIAKFRFDKTAQARWAWQFGWRLGRIIGTVKYQVPPV
jgi:hypothetical protein